MSETAFVKKLASNERPVREGAIEALKQYLSRDKKVSLLKYQKLWKGLFYSMWFSDRPRPQQRLAMMLGHLFDETIPLRNFSTFVEAFWTIIIREWPAIDHHRIDKFYLLLRRVVGCCFERLSKENWDDETVKGYYQTLEKNVISGSLKVPVSLPLHIIDIYLDELEKVVFADIEEIPEEDDSDEEDNEKAQQKKQKQREQVIEKVKQQKKERLAEVPAQYIIVEVFKRMKFRTEIKPLKARVDEELFADERVKEWGLKLDGEDNEDEDSEDEKDDEDDDEEKGEEEEAFFQ